MYLGVKGQPVIIAPVSILQQNMQRVTLVIAAGATTEEVTITSVTAANTRLRWGGYKISGDIATLNKMGVRVDLKDATTVRARRAVSDATYTITVTVTVCEYISGVITNMARGDAVMTSGNASVVVTPGFSTLSGAGGAEVAYLGQSTTYSGGKNINHMLSRIARTSNTELTAARWSSTDDTTVSYECASYSTTYLDGVNSVLNSSGTRAVFLGTDTNVHLDNDMTLSFGGDRMAGETDLQGAIKGVWLAGSAGVVYDKGIDNADSPSFMGRNVLRFKAGLLKRVASNGGKSITNGNSSATVIYPTGILDGDKTCVDYCGQATSSYTKTTANYANVWCRVSYDGSDTVTLDRGGTSGDNRVMYTLTEYY